MILIALLIITSLAAYGMQRGDYLSFFHDVICPTVVALGFLAYFWYCYTKG